LLSATTPTPALPRHAELVQQEPVKTCHAARATDLLRTQVDVALQEQNRDILLSMDRRARLQSQLQRILEVISIVTLTYYLTDC
jgi:uncharacterized membrane-anchored protein